MIKTDWSSKLALCVGLDTDINLIPKRWLKVSQPQFEFNKWIIDQTVEIADVYKINTAFYEVRMTVGWSEMVATATYLRKKYPEKMVILDAKRADIGSTNQAYAKAFFDQLGADAVTLNPYLGADALEPFLSRSDKYSIILCKTSNPGSNEIQDQLITLKNKITKVPLWQSVAYKVCQNWNQHQNCMLVVGATYPEELAQARQIIGDMPILIPGLGAQGGDLQAVLKNGRNKSGGGLILSVSRDVIFSDNPGERARYWSEKIGKLTAKK